MANSYYEILELRAIIGRELTDLYIRCSADDDGLVGGWYHKTIPPSVPAMDALRDAVMRQSYLVEWDRTIPPK